MDEGEFFAALTAAGLPEVPREFSVVPHAQLIPNSTLVEIDSFISLFDRVTTRSPWRQVVTATAPPIARGPHREVCFFTSWDFHLSPEHGWQLIECNDNGSGFFFAALINRLVYELAEFSRSNSVEPPATIDAFKEQLFGLVEGEAKGYFGALPDGLFLILEIEELQKSGRFRQELVLLRDLLRDHGLNAEIVSPEELHWDGKNLSWRRQIVAFIINRCTDFYWEAEAFSALRAAHLQNKVYVAPNPFTYATRSDKRLLEFLSLPDWDRDLGIGPEERTMLSAHVPETHLLREDNVDEIAGRREEFFFKPAHGFAGRGVFPSSQVGKGRLRQLVKKGIAYVAQKKAPKPSLDLAGRDGKVTLWTDLRVWSYRGKRFLVSGRGSTLRELLDLSPPGGWLPTLVKR